MESEGVLHVMKEHILQPVALVLPALMVNGQILQVLVVQIVLMWQDAILAILQAIVPLVLPDIKLMKRLDVLLAVLDIIHGHMVPLASLVQVENTLIQPQALVQAAVAVVPHALQLILALFAVLDMAIYLEDALNVMRELTRQVEPIPVNHVV